ncbi:hypothetical protein ASZ90_020083 [hydrocarbon metagenome]|uniref:Uncharacterized protein n=1 Tax=hydrocarbon metagenome TaxID=938273 RepID=A0A0W8E1V3_9ZZZZ
MGVKQVKYFNGNRLRGGLGYCSGNPAGPGGALKQLFMAGKSQLGCRIRIVNITLKLTEVENEKNMEKQE